MIRVRRVAQAVAEEVQRQDRHNDDHTGQQQPGRQRHRPDALGLLQEDALADGGGPQPQAQKAERCFAEDHGRDGQGSRGDQMAEKRRHHVAQDDAHLAGAGEAGRKDELLLAHGQKTAAHGTRQEPKTGA